MSRLARPVLAMWLAGAAHALPLHALDFAGPTGAERTMERVERLGSYAIPIGPWQDGSLVTRTSEGRVEMTAWRMAAPGMGTLEIMAPLRETLKADGWQVLFDCETRSCGGFDFRYATQVLPEPAMHVDLGDYRFLSVRRGAEVLSLLVSRSGGAGTGHVQMIRVSPAEPDMPTAALATKSEPGPVAAVPAPGSIGDALERGAVVLKGLVFESGAATLAGADEAMLADLAAYLVAHPDRSIALVGHTDAAGSAEANVALSRRRAEAVRTRLIESHGADAQRVQAMGAGFMAPRASNLTEEGRAANRRVEAILTSTR